MHENVKPFSKDATEILRNEIGYLFQNFALIDNRSVKYNLMIALEHVKEKNKSKLITEALVKVGMAGFENKKIFECSGGEQQRIAIARLLLKPCQIILCDEPTGSLDEENKQVIFDLLKYLQEQGKTMVVVTHDDELVEIADEVILIHKYKETAS
jgi:putative ABC transport system ATP-binding protein